MADLNDFNLPIYTTNYHDFVDTVRENIKRVKVTADAAIPLAQKGVASGVASLDGTGKLLSSFLPVGVVLEAPNDGQNYVRRSLSWQILPVIDDSAMIGNVALRPLKAGATQVMWVELAGQELSKTAYPRLWAWVQTYAPFAASLAAWNAGSQGMFLDASASTFRVPSFAGFPYLRVVTGARAPGSTEAAMVGPHPHPATASGGSRRRADRATG
jgi:hypothetical protein